MGGLTKSAFFYGTLLHPTILKRVIGNDGSHLEICPAILLDHTRHHIKGADYPAVVPYERSKILFDHELEPEDRSVRGTLVTGLSQSDIDFLDTFEGNEYVRTTVHVHPLAPFTSLTSATASPSTTNDITPSTAPPLPPLHTLAPPLPADSYIWSNPLSEVKKELWSYEVFVKENAWKWVRGAEGHIEKVEGHVEWAEAKAEDDREYYYEEVERRRAMGGNIVRVTGDEV
ncbi:hypothetical protein JAAARDRAFT_35959 [Jaapia argillacea MUCL 33604]|uniref:Putative gamma-glutamylcyclotransferase n=1 Tax=Jaapia argillacea MUCL 33604 TaxID=933084 RepID=A0A067PR91_9AGAM|nr:hypothetical protein JAAARDRAFT_35959 [Jaapia argillacea MUCL 33604]